MPAAALLEQSLSFTFCSRTSHRLLCTEACLSQHRSPHAICSKVNRMHLWSCWLEGDGGFSSIRGSQGAQRRLHHCAGRGQGVTLPPGHSGGKRLATVGVDPGLGDGVGSLPPSLCPSPGFSVPPLSAAQRQGGVGRGQLEQ